MTNNCLKSEKGVTLLTLTIYIIVLTAIVGIMAGVSSLFYNNIGMMKDAIENAGDFDTLNSCLISDSKSNSAVVVDETAKTIKFCVESPTIIFTESIFFWKLSTVFVGDSTQNLINQKIDYVLRYW